MTYEDFINNPLFYRTFNGKNIASLIDVIKKTSDENKDALINFISKNIEQVCHDFLQNGLDITWLFSTLAPQHQAQIDAALTKAGIYDKLIHNEIERREIARTCPKASLPSITTPDLLTTSPPEQSSHPSTSTPQLNSVFWNEPDMEWEVDQISTGTVEHAPQIPPHPPRMAPRSIMPSSIVARSPYLAYQPQMSLLRVNAAHYGAERQQFIQKLCNMPAHTYKDNKSTLQNNILFYLHSMDGLLAVLKKPEFPPENILALFSTINQILINTFLDFKSFYEVAQELPAVKRTNFIAGVDLKILKTCIQDWSQLSRMLNLLPPYDWYVLLKKLDTHLAILIENSPSNAKELLAIDPKYHIFFFILIHNLNTKNNEILIKISLLFSNEHFATMAMVRIIMTQPNSNLPQEKFIERAIALLDIGINSVNSTNTPNFFKKPSVTQAATELKNALTTSKATLIPQQVKILLDHINSLQGINTSSVYFAILARILYESSCQLYTARFGQVETQATTPRPP